MSKGNGSTGRRTKPQTGVGRKSKTETEGERTYQGKRDTQTSRGGSPISDRGQKVDSGLEDDFRRAREDIAQKIIAQKPPRVEPDVSEYYALSQTTLREYGTLDWQFHEAIEGLKKRIALYAEDRSRKRPLNIMLQAEPGSGKSYFIERLSEEIQDHEAAAVSFNMACMESISDLIEPLDATRNLKVNDKLPLLFLDEFDSNPGCYPVLLPLLWDGELRVGRHALQLGKVVIVLAGSGDTLAQTMNSARQMKREMKDVADKLPDVLSRINGGELIIPRLDEIDGDRNRKVDKVCIAISLLDKRFEHDLEQVPWALLNLIANLEFRYGARSIAHLIDCIPFKKVEDGTLRLSDFELPLLSVRSLQGSSLAYHIISDGNANKIVQRWKELRNHSLSVIFKQESSKWKILREYFRVSRRRRSDNKGP